MLGRFNHQEVDGWGSPQRVKSVNTDELSVTQLEKLQFFFRYFDLYEEHDELTYFGQREIMEVANESCLRWARGAATVQVRVLFDCCKRRESSSVLLYCLIIQPFAVSRLPPERTSSWSRRVEQRRM